MTNPNDHWRHQTSAAPHAPPHDRQTPGLPLNPQAGGMPLGGGAEPFRYDGQPSDAALALSSIITGTILSIMFMGVIFPSLYTLPSLVAVLGDGLADRVLRVVSPGLDPSSRLPLAMLGGAVAFWPAMRMDFTLSRKFAPYRIARHGLRLFMIGAFASLGSMADLGRFSMTPRGMRPVLFSDPEHLIPFVITVVVAHFVLTKATRVRNGWSRALTLMRLRPK